MSTRLIIEQFEPTKIIRIYVKGAPKFVIDLCNKYFKENGEIG